MTNETNTQVGRPSKLTQEMLDKANAYMLHEYETLGHKVPSHAGLCCHLGVVKSTVYEFAKVDNDLGRAFSNTLEAIKLKQETMLISGGLGGDYNATITKLMMANHGYSDKVETVVNPDDDVTSVVVNVKSAKKSSD